MTSVYEQQGETVKGLQQQLSGSLILPGSDEYEQARQVWNARVDKYPAGIVQPVHEQDIIATITFARAHGLPLAVRGGGHDYAGRALCDNGLVIDFASMKRVEVDPDKRTARVQAGARIEDLIGATRQHGLLTATGSLSMVGLAGLTLGGGYGPLMGKYGLVLDNLVGADIVTADGRLLSVSENEHPELFWGIRGGGGNFGVVTTFEYRLHALPNVTTGMVMYPLEQSKEAIRFYSEYAMKVPDELTIGAMFMCAPDGMPVFVMAPCYAGPIGDAEAYLEPLRTAGTPLMAAFQEVEYIQHISTFNALTPDGMRYYYKGHSFEKLEDDVIDVLIQGARELLSPNSALILHHFHGVPSRVASDATAFPQRYDHFMLEIFAAWQGQDSSQDQPHLDWTHRIARNLEPYALKGIYANMLDESERQRYPQAYGENYRRLVELKTLYDPENVFSSNVNIEPEAQSN